MSDLLFKTYSVKGNLKFYKTDNNDETITISIGINANHQIESNIYDDLNAFLEKMLIEDYINDETYQAKKAHEKALAKVEKEQASRLIKEEKQRKAKAKLVKKLSVSRY